jgi:hypothetical protein
MTIKNTDGSIFHLQKPNPIMMTQEQWEPEKLIFYNKFGKMVEEDHSIKKIEVKKEIQLPKPQKPDEPKIIEKIEVPKAEEIENKIQVWCLPGFYKEVTDPLYGEKYTKVTYGKKFMFEAILEDHNDLFIKMWINTKSVTVGSVIYPRISEKRWWRVQSIDQHKDMFLLTADSSDYYPDFSS